jgi:hypothetical protein
LKTAQYYTCTDCKTEYTLMLPQDAIDLYVAGAHVQDAFPMLSPDERELMISGVCGPCFDAMFPEEEEDDFDFVLLQWRPDGDDDWDPR